VVKTVTVMGNVFDRLQVHYGHACQWTKGSPANHRMRLAKWDGIDRTVIIAIPTESELNIIPQAPIQDPSLGSIIPHPYFKRAM
jgi:hypothetical protein